MGESGGVVKWSTGSLGQVVETLELDTGRSAKLPNLGAANLGAAEVRRRSTGIGKWWRCQILAFVCSTFTKHLYVTSICMFRY